MTSSLIDLLNSDIIDANDDDNDGAPDLFEISPYYTNDDAIQVLKSKTNSLKLLSLNCQSLKAKFSQLQIYLNEFDNAECPFSIICVQETWISDHEDTSLLQLDGYNFISQPKQCSMHGGVGIYLKDTFDYKILPILGNVDVWDGIFIEFNVNIIDSSQKKKIILGNIYRPARDIAANYDTFNEDMQHILSRLSQTNAEIFLTGDFNINLLKMHENELIHNFMDTLLTNSLLPKITLPTRLTSHSKTLIDNCFVILSTNFSKTTAGILLQNLSDHQPYL